MSRTFLMYPVLTENHVVSSGYVPSEPVAGYHTESEDRLLELQDCEGTGNSFHALLRDPICDWNPEEYDLRIARQVVIPDPSGWFGKEGVCASDAVLGLALHWSSAGTEEQNAIPFGEIRKEDRDVLRNGSLHFARGSLRTSLTVTTVVYLKDAGHPSEEEKNLCRQTGTLLGTLDSYFIHVDGNGSVFPIQETAESGKPLWYIYFASDDIMEDDFSADNVAVLINRSHPDYKFIDQTSPTYNHAFFTEILSSALTVMTAAVKKKAEDEGVWDDLLEGENYRDGSIADAMHYFITRLHWDTTDLIRMSDSIHLYINKNVRGEQL